MTNTLAAMDLEAACTASPAPPDPTHPTPKIIAGIYIPENFGSTTKDSEDDADEIGDVPLAGVALISHALLLAHTLSIGGQLGLIIEGRNEESSKERRRIRSHEGAPLDSFRYVGSDQAILNALAVRDSAGKMEYLERIEASDPDRLKDSLAFIDHKIVVRIFKRPGFGLANDRHEIKLRPSQAPHASYLEISHRNALDVVTIWPNATWQHNSGGLSSSSRDIANEPVAGFLAPLTVPRKYASAMRRNLETAILTGAASFEVPYNGVRFSLAGYVSKLQSSLSLSVPLGSRSYAGAGLRSFRFMRNAIHSSRSAQQSGITLGVPPMQPFGGDAVLLQNTYPDTELEFKEGLLETHEERDGDMIYHQHHAPDIGKRMRHSPFNPGRTFNFAVMFEVSYRELWCIPSSAIEIDWWCPEDHVIIPKAKLEQYHVQISRNSNWVEDLFAIMERFPGRQPHRQPASLDINAQYYTAANIRLGDDDDSDFDEDEFEPDEEVPQAFSIRKKADNHSANMRALNRVCAAHRKGIALWVGANMYSASSSAHDHMPNAVFYPSYKWSEEDYRVYVLLQGALPVGLHTGSIPPSATLIPIRWARIKNRFHDSTPDWKTVFNYRALPPMDHPFVLLAGWTERHLHGIPFSSLILLSEQFGPEDLAREVATIVGLPGQTGPAVAQRANEWTWITEMEHACNIERLLQDHAQKYHVQDGQGTYNFLMDLYESHGREVKNVTWSSSGTTITAEDVYLIRFHELLQSLADHYSPRWYNRDPNDSDDDQDDHDDNQENGPDLESSMQNEAGEEYEGATSTKSKAKPKSIFKSKHKPDIRPKSKAKPSRPKGKPRTGAKKTAQKNKAAGNNPLRLRSKRVLSESESESSDDDDEREREEGEKADEMDVDDAPQPTRVLRQKNTKKSVAIVDDATTLQQLESQVDDEQIRDVVIANEAKRATRASRRRVVEDSDEWEGDV